jgi:alcohol dehydrogenase class IV
MDALAQLVESFVSKRANPMTDSLCLEGIMRAGRSLKKAYLDGSNLDARSDMSLASLLSGITLTNAGLGAVHGIAAPLGGMCEAPHGAACAILLPFVMETNFRTLEKTDPEAPALSKYLTASKILTGSESAGMGDAIKWIKNLCRDLKIPPLSQFGLEAHHIPELASQSLKASSMKGNPVPLSQKELRIILEKALTWS